MTTRTITPATLAALALLPAVAGARPAVPLAVKSDRSARSSDPSAAPSHASARHVRTQCRHGHRVAADRWALYVAAVVARQVER